MERTILITGGAGFIGSHLTNTLLELSDLDKTKIIVVDILDYCSNIENLNQNFNSPNFWFYKLDIRDKQALLDIFKNHKVDTVIHLAAKSHVDESITNPEDFISNNINGAISLITTINNYLNELSEYERTRFKFINVSTDEVFGDREHKLPATEETAYNPSSPYSSSKASTDLIFHAFGHTYNIPYVTLYLCNNYGAYQYPEKLIPVTILQLLQGKKVKLYGDGLQVRNWMYVKDTVQLVIKIMNSWHGITSQRYVVAGQALTNKEVFQTIATKLEEIYPVLDNKYINGNIKSYLDLIEFSADRLGHDRKYEVNDFLLQTSEIALPENNFDLHIKDTISWYLENFSIEIKKLKTYDYQDFKQDKRRIKIK
ncbi:hypothetical protein CKF54_02885 [Psittacicella hinzii]|uniref:NAD(P)-binding domain-containing protein n=1 Tax=Psittacicella hinzii TaxID=2028575 RepID=A0A3A1YBB6_9GAMM|nr:GDP-mannose 4,6-dehydratase [Psittacicella hinzii]RIY33407.1 hypothetical protein CKF54_02885 [Psittacicella hinzii]